MNHFLKLVVLDHWDINDKIFIFESIDSLFFSCGVFFVDWELDNFIGNIEHIVYVVGSEIIVSTNGKVSSALNELLSFLSLVQ